MTVESDRAGRVIDLIDKAIGAADPNDPRFKGDPINWGDLRCVRVVIGMRYEPITEGTDMPVPIITATVEEAGDAWKLIDYLTAYLTEHGFPGVEIITNC